MSAKACKVCNALQLTGLCNPKKVLENPRYSCVASVPDNPGIFVNCGLAGGWLCGAAVPRC